MSFIEHTFDFVLEFMHRLTQAEIATWLCGGWAEELRGLCCPRPHQDIDLLYPTTNFEQLDQLIANSLELTSIPDKHFSHKRAILYKEIMIEFIMLELFEGGGYMTNFFNHRYQFVWPSNTLLLLFVKGQEIPVASKQALRMYRQQHHLVDTAYQNYLQEQC